MKKSEFSIPESMRKFGVSDFLIQRSSLLSSVRGRVTLEFGASNLVNAIAELDLRSGVESDVDERCFTRSLRKLNFDESAARRTVRIRRKSNVEMAILIVRLKGESNCLIC